MSKLSFILAAFLVAGNVNAAPEETRNVGLEGEIALETVALSTVGLGIVGAVVSNNRNDSAQIEVPKTPKCTGTDPLVNGLCVGTRQGSTVTVTGTGTGTATRTTTISVPVTFTYAPTLG